MPAGFLGSRRFHLEGKKNPFFLGRGEVLGITSLPSLLSLKDFTALLKSHQWNLRTAGLA